VLDSKLMTLSAWRKVKLTKIDPTRFTSLCGTSAIPQTRNSDDGAAVVHPTDETEDLAGFNPFAEGIIGGEIDS
jgi:hypothetical protein